MRKSHYHLCKQHTNFKPAEVIDITIITRTVFKNIDHFHKYESMVVLDTNSNVVENFECSSFKKLDNRIEQKGIS